MLHCGGEQEKIYSAWLQLLCRELRGRDSADKRKDTPRHGVIDSTSSSF
jgi:hypothetical protein